MQEASKCKFSCAARVIQDGCESERVWAVTYELHHVPDVGIFVPDRNDDRVIGEPSGGNELFDFFLERSRWVEELFHENILQVGQDFCNSSSSELLQGGHDTWRKFLGQVKILHRDKWM